MSGNVALYAAKKRKKPVQKVPKALPPDGTKSNPSKRHRDRLNSELDKLTSLLPFPDDIRARLDKLSVLRLSVGYLKVKSFFNATTKMSPNGSNWAGERTLMFGSNTVTSQPAPTAPNVNSTMVASIDGVTFCEGDVLLQALNGFVLVVTAEGYIFYTSPTIQDYLGFHQSDVVHQSVFELIHTDDRTLFKRQLHFALSPNTTSMDTTPAPHSDLSPGEVSSSVINYDPQLIPPENSSFLERSFCCRFRCLLDNSSGFLALNFRGRLKYLHGQNKLSEDGSIGHPQLALFAIATLVQPPSILEIRTKTLIFQTKHKLDFSPMGIDTRGKVVLGYSEIEICMKGTGYQFIHAADMMYCADNHLRMIKTGETGFTVFRLLSKSGTWVWVQANARMVFKGGRPDFIVARQRALTNEEGEEHLRLRHLQLPFSFTTGEALLYDVGPTLDVSNPCSAPKQRKLDDFPISPNSLLGCMLSQDQVVYCQHNNNNNNNTLSNMNDMAFKDTHALVNVPGDIRQHLAPTSNTSNLVKAEGTMQDMMETLQQILGDSELSGELNVEPAELKDWESMLLKMSSESCGMSEDMDDLLSNDILTYVEEQLLKEGGLKIPDQLDDIPVCLSGLDLQSQEPLMGVEQQNFNWTMEPQNQILPNRGKTGTKKQNSISGIMNLSHMGPPPEMGSLGLNGPTLQQIASQTAFSPSVGLHSDISPTGGLSKMATFNAALMDSCAQTQSQLRNLQPTANQNGHRSCSLRQTSANQFQSHQLPQSIQNQPTPSIPADLPISLLDQHPSRQFNPSCQNSQWISPVSDPSPADTFVENYIQEISDQSGFGLESSSSGFMQCQYPLATQNVENHGQTWTPQPQQQQQPQHMPTLLSNGHQHVSSCLGQAPGFQLGAAQVPENCRPFMPPNTSSTAFPTEQEMETPPLVPSNSCMFAGSAPSMPVNTVQLNQSSQQAPRGPSCQRFNTSNGQGSSESSCFYQGLPSSCSLGGMTVIPQGDTNVQPLSCQVAPGLALDSLLPQQQQAYINFSEQSQIKSRPIMGNGGFPFSSLPNGNTYYSKNN